MWGAKITLWQEASAILQNISLAWMMSDDISVQHKTGQNLIKWRNQFRALIIPHTIGVDKGEFVECAGIVSLLVTSMYCFYCDAPTDVVNRSEEVIGSTYLLGNVEEINPETLSKYGSKFRSWFGRDTLPPVLLTEMSPDVTADNSILYSYSLPLKITFPDCEYELCGVIETSGGHFRTRIISAQDSLL